MIPLRANWGCDQRQTSGPSRERPAQQLRTPSPGWVQIQEPQPKRWVSPPDLRKVCSSPREGGSNTGGSRAQPPRPEDCPRPTEQARTELAPGSRLGPGVDCILAVRSTDGRLQPNHTGRAIYFQMPLTWGRGSKYTSRDAGGRLSSWQLRRARQTSGTSASTSGRPQGLTTCGAIFTWGQVSVILDWVFT